MVTGEDLYPSARGLFRPGRETLDQQPHRTLAWLLAGVIAAVLGRRLLYWIDRNV